MQKLCQVFNEEESQKRWQTIADLLELLKTMSKDGRNRIVNELMLVFGNNQQLLQLIVSKEYFVGVFGILECNWKKCRKNLLDDENNLGK